MVGVCECPVVLHVYSHARKGGKANTRARARAHTHTHTIRSWTIGPSAKVYVQKPCPLAQDDGLVACLQPQHYPHRHLSIFRHSLAPT